MAAKKFGAVERGKLTRITVGLPAELVAELDRIAAAELRGRGRLVELLIRESLQHRETVRRVA
jgi:metal-responsive CopG/Arc/MetJ family transcriptional regulator